MNWNDHPHRAALLAEAHARPAESIAAPVRITHLVFLVDRDSRAADLEHLQKLVNTLDDRPHQVTGSHASVEVNGVRVRWERHTEFVSYTMLMPLADGAALTASARDRLDPAWLEAIPGRLLCVQQLDVLIAPRPQLMEIAQRRLHADSLVGSAIGGDRFTLLTDFRAQTDGAVHYLLGAPDEQRPRRNGRYVQRVLEIETYRMMALLGLPDARLASEQLEAAERALTELSERLRSARREDEAALLDDITALATEVEAIYANCHSRFSASAAYFSLVDTRVTELRESPLPGLQTIRAFLDRRLGPAMKTCSSTNLRLENLSRRIANVSELLRTRVGIEQSESQFKLLHTMTSRQGLQLRMQSAVEGLSVAAITYYSAGLIAYLARAAIPFGWPVSADLTVAIAVPVIACSVWLAMRRLHRRIEAEIRD